jgi:centrin-1
MSSFITKPAFGKAYTNEIRSIAVKNRAVIDEEYMEELKEAFVIFDSDHNKHIDLRELKAAVRALGFETTKSQCIQMFREVDRDPSDALNFEEFVRVMAPLLRKKDSKEEIAKIFDIFDSNKVGTISFLNLKKIA